MQTIAVIIIVSLAAAVMVWKIIKALRHPSGCAGCEGCPFSEGGRCCDKADRARKRGAECKKYGAEHEENDTNK